MFRSARAWPSRTQNLTLLHVALDYGITDHVKLLLEDKDHQVDFLDDQNGTIVKPLHFAVKHPQLWPVISGSLEKIDEKLNMADLYEQAFWYGNIPTNNRVCLPKLSCTKSPGEPYKWPWGKIKPPSGEQLTHMLEESGIGPVFQSGENDQIRDVLEELLKDISEVMTSKDKLMSFQPILSGSNSEGTKALLPDECDYLLVLTKLSNFVSVKFPICCAERPYVNFYCNLSAEYFSETGQLIKREYMHMFETLFDHALDAVKIPSIFNVVKTNFGTIRNPENPMKLTMRWLGEQNKDLVINIDLVPALEVNTSEISEHFGQTFVTPENDDDKTESKMYAVFKESGYYCHPPDFRLSFSAFEKSQIERVDSMIRKGFTLAKAMRSQLICPELQQPVTFCFSTAEESISTYVLKTCFLHLLQHCKDKDIPEELKALDGGDDHKLNMFSIMWATRIYELLEHYLKVWNHVPHAFNDKWDVYHKDTFTWEAAAEKGEHEELLIKAKQDVSLEYCR